MIVAPRDTAEGRELTLIKENTHCLELYRTHYDFLFQPDKLSAYCISVQTDSSFLFQAIKQISAIFTRSDSLSEIISFNVISKFKTGGQALHFALKIRWSKLIPSSQFRMRDDGRERETTVPPADCLKPWRTGTTGRPQPRRGGLHGRAGHLLMRFHSRTKPRYIW